MLWSSSFFSQRYWGVLDLVPIRVESSPAHVKSSSLPLGCSLPSGHDGRWLKNGRFISCVRDSGVLWMLGQG